MDRFIMYPVALITTVQPWIAAWVMSLSFFLTLMIVALLAKDRTVRQLAMMAVVTYIAVIIAVGLGTAVISGFQMVEFEVVSVMPKKSFD